MDVEVGDVIHFRTWNDMENEYGTDHNGDIKVGTHVRFQARHGWICGKAFTVIRIFSSKVVVVKNDDNEFRIHKSWLDKIAESNNDQISDFLGGYVCGL